MLDFGSGPGTTINAATRVFKEKDPNLAFIQQTIAIEPSSAMIAAAEEHVLKQFAGVKWKRFLFAVNEKQQFDLVT
jgi:hypothetical protein